MDDIVLVVRAHFDGHVPGEVISDIDEIVEVLAGPHQHDVIKRRGDPISSVVMPRPPEISAKS
jgi:hypothetical protein